MTNENRLISGLEDIKAIRFECRHCHATASFDPDHWEKIPFACTNCGKQWILGGADESLIRALKNSITQLRTASHPDFALRFEFLLHEK